MTRRTLHKLILLLWLAVFFMIGYGTWHFQAGELMIIGYVLVSVVIYIVYAFSVRCPACEMPVLLRPVRIFGMEIYLWSLLTPPKCRHCGKPLSEE